jgi:DNA-binding transcriptional MerR regulator
MYSIGDFSKINKITPKTLRHYDRIDLLKPAFIDERTGYRFYSVEQLPVIRKILMLKELGFTLSEIQLIMNEESTIASLLMQREKQIQQTIREEQQMLVRVREYLVKIKGERTMSDQVQIKSLPEVIVASMRTKVANYDTYFNIVPKMGEYMRSVGAVCTEPAYCFTIYHDGEYRESDIDVEICESVVAHCKESEKVTFKTISAVADAACLYHKGSYKTIHETYNQLFQWISCQGYDVIDNPRESYVDGIWNKKNEAEWLTEVQVPVKKK